MFVFKDLQCFPMVQTVKQDLVCEGDCGPDESSVGKSNGSDVLRENKFERKMPDLPEVRLLVRKLRGSSLRGICSL